MRAIIIDDEQKAIKMLEIELQRAFPTIQILGGFYQPELGINAINTLQPDLLFLDIEMPNLSGFDVLKRCIYQNMQIIFTTAYSEYALQAIKANALDYLLKPIDTEELIEAVKKAAMRIKEQQFSQVQLLLNKLETPSDTTIKIPSGDQVLFFQPNDIIYCKAESNYTTIVTINQRILVSKTLKYMSTMLPTSDFYRVHQSYLVNKNHIRAFSRIDGGYVTLSNGDIARVAKNKRHLVI